MAPQFNPTQVGALLVVWGLAGTGEGLLLAISFSGSIW